MSSRARWVAAVALGVAGCAAPSDDRAREYASDGVHLYQNGDYRSARESFDAALALRPEDPVLLYDAGQCCERLGDAARAEQLYGKCLEQAPNHVACRHAQTQLLVRQNRRPEAVQMVQGWLAREPKLAAPYAEDAWLWAQAGDLPRAQARLQQAIDLDPHDVRALTELGRLYEQMQRPERALVLYERSLAQDPRKPEVQARVNALLTSGVKRPHPE